MNYKQIRELAESECAYLLDPECTKIQVAAQWDNELVDPCFNYLSNWAKKAGAKGKVIRTGSLGYYDLEPIVIIEKQGQPPVLYSGVTEGIATELLRDYIEGDNPRPDLALCTVGNEGSQIVADIPAAADLPLFNLQKRIALRNCGKVDPLNINHSLIEYEGYTGLTKVLNMSQVEVIEVTRQSGLKGRGGAGYLTADQWKIALDTEESEKYVICNAVDGDLRAQTARILLEGDPHSVLEGLLIAAYVVGASHCIVAVAMGNDGIVKKLEQALAQMMEYNLLGENILDSAFSCNIEIKEVAPSLVAGEETALLRSLEGKQAMPYLRGDLLTSLRFNSKPTLINNLETFADVSAIFQRSDVWFSSQGTAESTGTKVISLSGEVVHRYTVEVPFGTDLSDVIQKIGGGIPGGRSLKAVQFGGLTSAYFGADELAKSIDYQTLRAMGSFMGSGTINVVADNTCAVEMTEKLMAFLQSQSCGKCVFCREGTLQMSDILQDIAQGEGKEQDLDLLKELGEEMRIGAICGFGQGVANPVLSSMKLFRHEFDVHIKEKRCPIQMGTKE